MDADLIKVLRGFCESLTGLRNDLVNTAAIENAEAFAGMATAKNSKTIQVADMPPPAGAVASQAYENKLDYPVAVHIRAGPVQLGVPPAELLLEAAVLLLDTDANVVVNPLRASVKHTDMAKGATFVLPPNKTLWFATMASAAVDVTWFVVPLRGRTTLFGG